MASSIQFRYLGNIAVPNFKGADTIMATGQSTTGNGNNMPILQFENNEAYGAMQGGFTLWWVGSQDPQPAANAQDSVIKNLKIWNIYNKAVYMYPSQKVTFDGLKIRGSVQRRQPVLRQRRLLRRLFVEGHRHPQLGHSRDGGRHHGAGSGLWSGTQPDGREFVSAEPRQRRGADQWVGQRLLDGQQAGGGEQHPVRGAAGPESERHRDGPRRRERAGMPGKLDEVRVYAYNGVATDNFQVYHSSTSVLPRPPAGCTPTTRAGIKGLTCPIAAQGPVVPTATLSASPTSIAAGAASTLTWATSNATTVSINQGIGTVAASGTRSVSPAATTTYTLTATNAAGSVTATATVSIAAGDTTPPEISAVASVNVTATGATITFTTNEPAFHQVEYGRTTAYGTLTTLDTTLRTSHTQVLTGLTSGTVYHYRAHATDAAGNRGMSADFTFTTSGGPPPPTAISIWSASAAPTTFATADSSSVELGLKFRSDVAGTVTGVRFYKGTITTGTHSGTLWTASGTKLASATFTGETASGWQTVSFSSPVAITANTVYVVSYHSNVGHYAYTAYGFTNAGVDNGPLHALKAGVSGDNGVYTKLSSIAFPTSSYNSSNYWVDILFVPAP